MDAVPHERSVSLNHQRSLSTSNQLHAADGGKAQPPLRYVQLENLDGVTTSAANKYSPVRLWNDTIGHGIARATRALQRRSASADSCATHTRRLTKLPKDLVNVTKETGSFYSHHWPLLQREVLCGFAAMLLQIPETIAFSYVANLDPVVGLYATGFFGIIVGLFGGVPATVAGAAGALAVVMPQLTGSSGSLGDLPLNERIEHLFVAVTIAGIFQLIFGILGFSKVFSMIPRTAHIGFLNGLALMMFISQMTTFKVCTDVSLRFGACEVADKLKWMSASDATTWMTVFFVVLTMALMHFFPKTPVIGRMIPPTLVVAVIGITLEHGINRPLLKYDVRTIGDTSPLSGGLPSFGLPDFGGVTNWSAVLSCAASLGAVGLFESIMTLQAVVDLTKKRLTPEACQKECIAQGVGNIVCGFFAAMGGCSMIGQSTGNVLNGGRFRVSAVVGGITTFAVVLFASSLIELVPVACLTGILFIIIIHTFYWPSLKLIFHLRLTDSFAIILVTALAAAINLAVAVIAGVIWQSLVNGWRSGQQLSMRTNAEFVKVYRHPSNNSSGGGDSSLSGDVDTEDNESSDGVVANEEAKVYHIKGHLLYSSVATFRPFFEIDADPPLVIVDLSECLFGDFSAVAALREAATRYREAGKLLVARNLCAQSLDFLHHDLGWDHVDSIHLAFPPVDEHDDVERQSGPFHMIPGSHVMPSPLPHLHLVSPFSPSTSVSPSASSYHVLHN
ncbi:Sulfate permease [Globisporangium polare]